MNVASLALPTKSCSAVCFQPVRRSGSEFFVRRKVASIGGYWNSILENGRHFQEIDVHESQRLRRRYDCQLGRCAFNCQQVIAENPEFAYFQGIGRAGSSQAFEHAWVARKDRLNVAIDPTWHISEGVAVDFFGEEVPASIALRDFNNPAFTKAVQAKGNL